MSTNTCIAWSDRDALAIKGARPLGRCACKSGAHYLYELPFKKAAPLFSAATWGPRGGHLRAKVWDQELRLSTSHTCRSRADRKRGPWISQLEGFVQLPANDNGGTATVLPAAQTQTRGTKSAGAPTQEPHSAKRGERTRAAAPRRGTSGADSVRVKDRTHDFTEVFTSRDVDWTLRATAFRRQFDDQSVSRVGVGLYLLHVRNDAPYPIHDANDRQPKTHKSQRLGDRIVPARGGALKIGKFESVGGLLARELLNREHYRMPTPQGLQLDIFPGVLETLLVLDLSNAPADTQLRHGKRHLLRRAERVWLTRGKEFLARNGYHDPGQRNRSESRWMPDLKKQPSKVELRQLLDELVAAVPFATGQDTERL